jgi:hypothetical protein
MTRFRCPATRTRGAERDGHGIRVTGRTKPYRRRTYGRTREAWSREFVCECGVSGWSAHPDLELLAERRRKAGGRR